MARRVVVFPAPLGPDDGDELPGLHPHGHPGKGGHAAEGKGHAFHVKLRHLRLLRDAI